MHFDVGNNYQGAQPGCNAQCSFIVPATYAQARPVPDGNGMNEITSWLCKQNCAYPSLPYPVLSFEYGFASVRDGNTRSEHSRAFLARPALASSVTGSLPTRWEDPTMHKVSPSVPFTGLPLQSPDILPFSYSGIAQPARRRLHGDVRFVAIDNPSYDKVGSPPEVAQTLMHEVGHSLGLHHAGLADQPNCIPNYPSIMNYLYQIRGLTDAQRQRTGRLFLRPPAPIEREPANHEHSHGSARSSALQGQILWSAGAR